MTTRDQIFISYSSRDAGFVSRLASSLEQAGISTWVDRKRIAGGDQWMESLANAMDCSSAVILVISPDAVKSRWVMNEISFATRRGMRVMPVICRDTQIPALFDFSIGGIQRIDFTKGTFQDALNSLTQAIQALEKKAPGKTERATPGDFQIYVEDIWEFVQKVPARMFSRFGRLNGLSVTESIFRVILFATPGLLPSVVFNLILLSVVAFIMNLVFPYPHELMEDVIMVISIALAAGSPVTSRFRLPVPDTSPDQKMMTFPPVRKASPERV